MNILARCIATIIILASAVPLFAGGSGLNVVVVVNDNSADSIQLGNYYCEKRQIPAQNVLRINWTGGNVEWSLSDYQNILLNPLTAMLASRGLTNQIEYVVLSMDIPYRVNGGAEGVNNTPSTLFYGFKSDPRGPYTCPLATNSESAYAGSEGIFRQTLPITATNNSFLATMITSSNLALARQIVDNGVLGDGTFPTQTVHLVKTYDPARSVRYVLFDNAIFNARLRGDYSMLRTNLNDANGLSGILGLDLGLATYSVAGTLFAPGAMADSLTSFGGFLFEERYGQTSLLDFLQAGAAGSYGTVVEPCNYLEKFPSPQNYFYQARGFSLAECYYQSVTNPYEGLTVGEPLSAPFAEPCNGSWINPPPSALLSGTTNLSLEFTAADVSRPVQHVDLFLDGILLKALTNIAPAEGNVLYVTLPGATTISYTISSNAGIALTASGLADELNNAVNTNATGVGAFLFGDRIELRSTDLNRTGNETFVSVSNAIGSALELTTSLHASRTNFLDTTAFGMRSYVIGIGVVTNDFLTFTAIKTNGASFSASITNYAEGVALWQFIQQLMNAINGISGLQGNDGLIAEDLMVISSQSPEYVQFNLRARSPGIKAAQIQTSIAGSFDVLPTNAAIKLDENLADLQPRNHLYITAGTTNLTLNFPFDTTTIADGWHELTAVAYEGSHVRTQKRISQTVFVQNTLLSPTFAALTCDTNCGLQSTMEFAVVANAGNIARIELFSTGGSCGVVTNQSSTVFSVAAASLQLGLHPFYALVTRDDGKQFRTETKWIRIKPSFSLSIAGSGPTLSWLAETGTVYEVLSALNVTGAFVLRDSLTATNATVYWQETNSPGPQQFYKVRTQP